MLDSVVREILRALGTMALNYGLRARCGDLVGIDDDTPKDILEARERGVSEAYMAVLKICAPVNREAEDALRFVTQDTDEAQDAADSNA